MTVYALVVIGIIGIVIGIICGVLIHIILQGSTKGTILVIKKIPYEDPSLLLDLSCDVNQIASSRIVRFRVCDIRAKSASSIMRPNISKKEE